MTRWPESAIDGAALRAVGWRPVPFQEFVLKVHQRCNLTCDYCYVYTKEDLSWRERPATMPTAVWRATAERIGEHVRRHEIPSIRVILHGGEPMMAGSEQLVAIAAAVRESLPSGARADIALQTNGTLLTPRRLDPLREAGVKVAVSLDGVGDQHDRHRSYPSGRGSFATVRRGLELLSGPYRSIYAGLLCTINPDTDPVDTWRAMLEFHPPGVDFLLPHANWQTGVPRNAYGPWLVRLFDDYLDAPRKLTSIRLFDELISLCLGGPSHSEHVGLSPAAVAVIESDGAIEQTDALKSAYAGAPATGFSVLTDAFDAALDHPGIVARQLGRDALAAECLRCPIVDLCGGGHYVHRFRADSSGFRNPTVYCEDMKLLTTHACSRITASLTDVYHQAPQPARRGDALIPTELL
jgi:uncharacterized protein